MTFSHDICIVGLKCYDLLAEVPSPRYLGGVEKQLVSLARGLRRAGLRVAFITYDHGQPDREIRDGIVLFKSFAPAEGWPVLRFVHPRMTKLRRAVKRASAFINIQMGAGVETGVVAFACKNTKKFIYLVASDADCERSLPFLHYRRERLLYRYGLSSADLIISQTKSQQNMLRSNLGTSSTVLPLPCSWAITDKEYVPPVPPEKGKTRVLWVGRIVEAKRLEWLLSAAARCPNILFDVVGTPNVRSAYYEALVQQAKQLANVTMHGKVSSEILEKLYRDASLMCCTSELEGFPTTFLEAWNYGLPVLTTFDPDGVVLANRIGWVADTLDDFVTKLCQLVDSPQEWKALSRRARQFFCDNYTTDALIPRYMEIFNRLQRLDSTHGKGDLV